MAEIEKLVIITTCGNENSEKATLPLYWQQLRKPPM